MNASEELISVFGNRLRVRVCGICIENDSILLIRHINLGEKGVLWSPPGGGMEFGETAEEALKREFEEETGLKIKVNQFLFVNEFLKPPLHGIELFFLVEILSGKLVHGYDPEITSKHQIIQQVEFVTIDTIHAGDGLEFHAILKKISNMKDIQALNGYYLNGG